MRFIKEHIDYLKDNPKGYWFKRKLYGWGWTPATWQGWAVIGAYVGFVLWFVYKLENTSEQVDWAIEFAMPLALVTTALIVICYKTGEPPKWQFGISEKKNENEN